MEKHLLFKIKFICLLFITAGTIGCKDKEPSESNNTTMSAVETVQPAGSVQSDPSTLIGEWTRTDAPYLMKILEAGDSGKLKVGYFNPKSIHVGKSSWTRVSDSLKVYVELQDVNYPGSNYSLVFIPGRNLLSGTYFQAVEGATYSVEFIRTK